MKSSSTKRYAATAKRGRIRNHSQRGAILVVAPLVIIALIMMFGFGIETGRVALRQLHLQRALDASSIAGIRVLRSITDPNEDEIAVSTLAASRYLATNLANSKIQLPAGVIPTYTFDLNVPPKLTVTLDLPTTFGAGFLFGNGYSKQLVGTATAAVMPLAVSIVIDQSESMCSPQHPAPDSSNCTAMMGARAAAKAFVVTLNESLDYVGVTSHGTFAAGMAPNMDIDIIENGNNIGTWTAQYLADNVPATQYLMNSDHFDIDAVNAAIDSVQVLPDDGPDTQEFGWTNTEMGLEAAYQQLLLLDADSWNDSLKVIILLADGNPSSRAPDYELSNFDETNYDNAILKADEIRAQGIVIYTIALGTLAGEGGVNPYQPLGASGTIRGKTMRRIAFDTSRGDPGFHNYNPDIMSFAQLAARGDYKGRFLSANDSAQLSESFKQVAEGIQEILTE